MPQSSNGVRHESPSLVAGRIATILLFLGSCCVAVVFGIDPLAIVDPANAAQAVEETAPSTKDVETARSAASDAPHKLEPADDAQVADDSDEVPAAELERVTNSIGMQMVLVPAGDFTMGSRDEKWREAGEKERRVTIEEPFYVGVHEVTQAQYEQVMGTNPSTIRGADLPVENVAWTEAMRFCAVLSQHEDQTYRLPTEKEWEYACRAGTTTPFYHGTDLGQEHANFDSRYPYGAAARGTELPQGTKPVGSYKPNAFELYDMHGNVWEWCLDRLADSGDQHISRGGSWRAGGRHCRSAERSSGSGANNAKGFRVVRTLKPIAGQIEVPDAPPTRRALRFTTSELIAKIDEAFSQPPVSLLPPVVIFPVVDGDLRLRNDGGSLAYLAMYALANRPQRRMDICTPRMRYALGNSGALMPGRVLDDTTIEISLAAADAEFAVLPQLTEEDGRLLLKSTLREAGQTEPTVTFEHTIDADQLVRVPGMIAKDVLMHLGADLDDDDYQRLDTPSIKTSADLRLLSQFTTQANFGEKNALLESFLARNPKCLVGWMYYVYASHPANVATQRYERVADSLNCGRLQIAAAGRKPASEESLLSLLELWPWYSTDNYYHWTLVYIARHLNNPVLTAHLFRHWQEAVPQYSGCLARGRESIDWAWQARGGQFAYRVSQKAWSEFGDRIELARQELEQAIEISPLGFEAHAQLLVVAKATSQSRAYANEHFHRAIEIRPGYYDAYAKMYDLLQPKWGGQPEELVAFCHECVDTGLWDHGIPQLGRHALENICYNASDSAFIRGTFRSPSVFAASKAYFESAEANAPPAALRTALNCFAKHGAYGGHYDDVAEAFARLEEGERDDEIFWDGFTYGFLKDLVYAETSNGTEQQLAQMRVALAEGDFDAAEQILAEMDEAATDETRIKYERIIETGRRLEDDGSLTFSSADMAELFEGVDAYWQIEDDALVCRLGPGTRSQILLPFGIVNVEITGKLSWSEPPWRIQVNSHTRALRDNVSIAYLPGSDTLELRRSNVKWKSATFRPDEVNFRIVRNDDSDVFQPAPQVQWEAVVYEQSASGFGFEVQTTDSPATVMLRDVTMTLLP